MSEGYYAVLGVSETATQEEIKKIHRGLVKLYHPDSGNTRAEEKFKEIQAAYDILSNPEKREQYDRERSSGAAADPNGAAKEPEWDAGHQAAYEKFGGKAPPPQQSAPKPPPKSQAKREAEQQAQRQAEERERSVEWATQRQAEQEAQSEAERETARRKRNLTLVGAIVMILIIGTLSSMGGGNQNTTQSPENTVPAEEETGSSSHLGPLNGYSGNEPPREIFPVTRSRVGPVSLGMTENEVQRELGQPYRINSRAGRGDWREWYPVPGGTLGVSYAHDRVRAAVTNSAWFRTDRGVGPDRSWQEVRRAYHKEETKELKTHTNIGIRRTPRAFFSSPPGSWGENPGATGGDQSIWIFELWASTLRGPHIVFSGPSHPWKVEWISATAWHSETWLRLAS